MRFTALSHTRVAEAAAVVVFMAIAAVSAQIPSASQAGRGGQPGQATQAPATTSAPTGIIRGHITAAATGKPLARVRVSLVSTKPGVSLRLSASSSATGAFELKDVAPGQYRVSAARPGYLTLEWGQQHAREQGRALDVKAGQTVDRIDVALPKGSVMAGQITDELGQPYPGVRVDAMELRYLQGGPRRVPFPSGGATTDDRGQFRISDLSPGLYYLTASSSERWIGNDRQSYGYGIAYFPGVRSDQAQPITLGLSQQRMDLNFNLAVSRTVRIAGRVQTASGEPLSIESVSIARSVGSGFTAVGTVATARFNRDGTFEIPDVNTGDYRLSVRGRSSAGPETAALRLNVGDAPLEGLLAISRGSAGSNVNGVVVTDENTPVPFAPVVLRVNIIPGTDADVLSSVRVVNVAADSSFRLTGIGGAFYFRLLGLPESWMVKSVRMNDDDITEVEFNVPVAGKDLSGLQIVVTEKVGSVSGTVVDDRGRPTADATVVVFPEDPRFVNPAARALRTIRPDASGRFTVGGLPAGKYYAAARDYVEDGQQFDPVFLEELKRGAPSFELLEGSSANVSLKLPRP